MKHLYLVRHAKSDWANPGLPDFERPLNERGNRDKKLMGKRLAEKSVLPNAFISSSSKRTTQTSVALAKKIGFPTREIQFYEEIYHASPFVMLSFINKTENKNNSLMLVGHNPGISMLCDYLCNYAIDFPTLGMAKISFEVDDWMEVSAQTGTLDWFDYPKNQS
ncbi:MAG: histidine phosphatase family protein [Flavobacteriales bacterium]